VTIVAGSVQLSKDGKLIRIHPIRHDRAKELAAFANPKGRPGGRTPPPETSPTYRNSFVARVPELDSFGFWFSASSAEARRRVPVSAGSGDVQGSRLIRPGAQSTRRSRVSTLRRMTASDDLHHARAGS
jgi:hypothetical protein